MKKQRISHSFILVIISAGALAIAGWMWLELRRDLALVEARQSDLARLMALRSDLVAAGAGTEPRDAAEQIKQHFGMPVEVESSEDTTREGWKVRRHAVKIDAASPATLDSFFAFCASATPRLLIEELEVSGAPDNRLSVRLVVADLLKN